MCQHAIRRRPALADGREGHIGTFPPSTRSPLCSPELGGAGAERESGEAARRTQPYSQHCKNRLMATLWIGSTFRRPAVELVTDTGERLPLPLPVDDSSAADCILDRSGWVAIQVGYQVVGVRDGDLLRPSLLPDAWSIAPAADPTLVLLQRHFDEGQGNHQGDVIELVDQHGHVVRSITGDVWGVVGELRSGWIVTHETLVSWQGERRPLPAPGQAVAVLSGRHLVIADSENALVHVVDTELDHTASTSVPADAFFLMPTYNVGASQVAFACHSPVIARAHEILTLPAGKGVVMLAWLDDDHLVQVGERTCSSVNVGSGIGETLTGFPPRSFPRVNVSGRFETEQLRNALLPEWSGPIPDDARDRTMHRHRTMLEMALQRAGLAAEQLLPRFVPAVHLRSCFAGDRVPVGTSHFGGRPDLPPDHQWPVHDGQPMMFIGQFRADEINAALPAALPSNVRLAVFAAIEPDGGYPVSPNAVAALTLPVDGLRRVPWPTSLPPELQLTMSIAVAEPMLTPPPSTPGIDADQFEEIVAEAAPAGPAHQLFGTAYTIQGHEGPPGHRLLFQFDGDSLLGGPELGDGGRLLVWSPADAEGAAGLGPCIIELDSH